MKNINMTISEETWILICMSLQRTQNDYSLTKGYRIKARGARERIIKKLKKEGIYLRLK